MLLPFPSFGGSVMPESGWCHAGYVVTRNVYKNPEIDDGKSVQPTTIAMQGHFSRHGGGVPSYEHRSDAGGGALSSNEKASESLAELSPGWMPNHPYPQRTSSSGHNRSTTRSTDDTGRRPPGLVPEGGGEQHELSGWHLTLAPRPDDVGCPFALAHSEVPNWTRHHEPCLASRHPVASVFCYTVSCPNPSIVLSLRHRPSIWLTLHHLSTTPAIVLPDYPDVYFD